MLVDFEETMHEFDGGSSSTGLRQLVAIASRVLPFPAIALTKGVHLPSLLQWLVLLLNSAVWGAIAVAGYVLFRKTPGARSTGQR